MKVQKEKGLQVSEKVLKELKKLKLNKEVYVGVFTNCRECGYTFKVSEKFGSFTWCVYEHRNSDNIIINGKEGYISLSGDLPYSGNSKYDYLACFKDDEYKETAKELAKMINNFAENKN